MPSHDWLWKLGIGVLVVALGVGGYFYVEAHPVNVHVNMKPNVDLTFRQTAPDPATSDADSSRRPSPAKTSTDKKTASDALRPAGAGAATANPAVAAATPAIISSQAIAPIRIPTGHQVLSGPPVVHRGDHYLPANTSGWTAFDVVLNGGPVVVRAGGQVTSQTDSAGPDGLRDSNYERALVRRRVAPGRNERVVGLAPYLSLVGRICSGGFCSDPFVVGAKSVICPSPDDARGELQLWTNNYIRVDGTQTLNSFSQTSGGYSFQTETAGASACDAKGAPVTSAVDLAVLAEGGVLDRPEFTVSSSQSSWKPFFIPLGAPLRVRATGEMRPHSAVDRPGRPAFRWPTPSTGSIRVNTTSCSMVKTRSSPLDCPTRR